MTNTLSMGAFQAPRTGTPAANTSYLAMGALQTVTVPVTVGLLVVFDAGLIPKAWF